MAAYTWVNKRTKDLFKKISGFIGLCLTRDHLPLGLAVLAMLLTLPALWVGLQLDDYSIAGVVQDLNPSHRGPLGFLDAFSFLNGDPQDNNFFRTIGILPWWSSDHLRISFFRPISAFLMWFDFKMWPGQPVLMHLQSLFWYGALVAAVALLYRRIAGVTIAAGLAALLYAVDCSHAIPVSWLSNRTALIAAFFGVLCLISHDKWRREGRGLHGILSPFFLVLSLLSGEMGLSTYAYLAAYAFFLDGHGRTQRLFSLLPCALVFVVWALVYSIFGYGVKESGFYIDPSTNPVLFLKTLTIRAPLLLMGQWSHVSPDQIGTSITFHGATIFAVIFIILLTFLLFPLLRRDKESRFWLTGMLISLLPVVGVEASSRNLVFVGIGAMALMSRIIVGIFQRNTLLPSARKWRIPAYIGAVYLVVAHLLLSPVLMPVIARFMKNFEVFTAAARTIPIDENKYFHDHVVLVNAPLGAVTNLIFTVRMLENRTLPRSVALLSQGATPLGLYRIDETSLRARIPGGLFSDKYAALFRSSKEPVKAGQVFYGPLMAVTVTKTGNNGPEELVFHFSVPLESESLKWFEWKGGAYIPFVPPAVGESMIIAPPAMSFGFAFDEGDKKTK